MNEEERGKAERKPGEMSVGKTVSKLTLTAVFLLELLGRVFGSFVSSAENTEVHLIHSGIAF